MLEPDKPVQACRTMDNDNNKSLKNNKKKTPHISFSAAQKHKISAVLNGNTKHLNYVTFHHYEVSLFKPDN